MLIINNQAQKKKKRKSECTLNSWWEQVKKKKKGRGRVFKPSWKAVCGVTWGRTPVKTIDRKGNLELTFARLGPNTSCIFPSREQRNALRKTLIYTGWDRKVSGGHKDIWRTLWQRSFSLAFLATSYRNFYSQLSYRILVTMFPINVPGAVQLSLG